MTSLDAGRPASERDSNVSLGLVGVPGFSEPTQTADAFEFDANPNIDHNIVFDDSIFANFNKYCTDAGQSPDVFEAVAILPPQTGIGETDLSQNFAANEQHDSLIFDPLDPDLFPVQQNFGYPDPQGCFTGQEAPYFQNGYDPLAPPVDVFGTLCLAAIPGNNTLTGYEDVQYPPHQYEFLPDSWTLPAKGGSVPLQVAVDLPVDPSLQFGLHNPNEDIWVAPAGSSEGSLVPIVGAPMSPMKPWKFTQSSDSDTDEENHD